MGHKNQRGKRALPPKTLESTNYSWTWDDYDDIGDDNYSDRDGHYDANGGHDDDDDKGAIFQALLRRQRCPQSSKKWTYLTPKVFPLWGMQRHIIRQDSVSWDFSTRLLMAAYGVNTIQLTFAKSIGSVKHVLRQPLAVPSTKKIDIP